MRTVRVIAHAALVLLLAGNSVRAQEVQWRSDYNAAVRESSEKNRPLFMDVGKEACLHCVRLDVGTFRDPAVVKILNESFVPVKVDGEKNSVQILGQVIYEFPTLVFMGPDNTVVAVQKGYIDGPTMLQQSQKVLAALAQAAKPVAKTPTKPPAVASTTPAAAALPPPPPQAPKQTGLPPFQGEAKIGTIDTRRTVWPGPRDMLTNVSGNGNGPILQPIEERTYRARQLLTLAQEDYQRQQWLACLEHCKTLTLLYADTQEGLEGRQLALRIKGNPELLERLSRDLTENLAEVYWELAHHKLRQNQPTQAIPFLEKIVQTCPGSRYSSAAQDYINRLSANTTTAAKAKPATPTP